MVSILDEYLESKFNYKLDDYAIYEIHRGKNNVRLISTILFLIALSLYVLNVLEIFENMITLGWIIVLLAVLIVAPYSLVKSKFEAIIVTPKYLIQRVAKRQFVVLEFDKITHFEISEEGIVIKQDKKRLVLSTELFQEEIEPIVEILEAKGKTFDKEKDYMIRKIKIIIENNKVSIEDDEEMTVTQQLYQRFQSDFPFLTPGYLSEIMFRNTAVEDVMYDEGNVFLFLDSVEVKGGHPANTTFDNLRAHDCIMMLENMKFKKVYRQNLNEKERPIEEFDTDVEEAIEHLENAIINEWKIDGKSMTMSFAEGVYLLHTEFSYDEVTVGWKTAK